MRICAAEEIKTGVGKEGINKKGYCLEGLYYEPVADSPWLFINLEKLDLCIPTFWAA